LCWKILAIKYYAKEVGHQSKVLFLFLFFAVLGLELRAYASSHSTSPFLGFFKVGSRELFAQVGFELRSS
jgi:hypothetical protein